MPCWGAALLVGSYYLFCKRKHKGVDAKAIMHTTDNLVYTGFAFLMTGLLLGAVWGKLAWGTYWNWDPKETWAAITVFLYLLYIHHRLHRPRAFTRSIVLLIVGFLFLQICWYGVNYLPSAKDSSIHTYTR